MLVPKYYWHQKNYNDTQPYLPCALLHLPFLHFPPSLTKLSLLPNLFVPLPYPSSLLALFSSTFIAFSRTSFILIPSPLHFSPSPPYSPLLCPTFYPSLSSLSPTFPLHLLPSSSIFLPPISYPFFLLTPPLSTLHPLHSRVFVEGVYRADKWQMTIACRGPR